MPLDITLVNAFLALTPQPTPTNRQIIMDALDADEMDIYIPGMPLRTVSLSVDYAVFMFCYPWETNNSFAPLFTRQPLPQNYDQSSPDYGNRSFALAAQYGIDVMVGYWVNGPRVFENFRNSISRYKGATPYVAYSMEFADAGDPAVGAHIDLLWREEFNLPRYCRLGDRANRWRFPVIFWGVDEVGPSKNNALPDAGHIQRLGALLTKLKSRRTNDGGQAYVIWHSQMLNRYLGLPAGNLKNMFKTQVMDQIDAFYQHEISIPSPNPPVRWNQIDVNHWETFPHTPVNSGANLNETRHAQDAIAREGNLIASDGFPIIVIPGAMPQFSRERLSYQDHQRSNTLSDNIDASRINCTSLSQISQTLLSMEGLAETYRLKQQNLSWTARRMVSLSTWNEYREGTTWEPCAPDNNDPKVFGITDSSGLFLDQARRAFSTQTFTYRIGDDNFPGGPGHPGHPGGPGGPGGQQA